MPQLLMVGVSMLVVTVAGARLTAPAAADRDVPDAEALIERHIEVTGGRDAYALLRNRKITGTLEHTGRSQSYEIVIHESPPANRHVQLTGSGGETLRFIVNGDESWTYDAAFVVASSGEQRRQEIRRAAYDMLLSWRDHYSSADTVGAEEIDGRSAHLVRLTAPDGHTVELLFDDASGRVVLSRQELVFAGTTIRSETTIEGYRAVDGVELPARMRRVLDFPGGRMVQEYEYDSIEHNVEMPQGLFATPPELDGP